MIGWTFDCERASIYDIIYDIPMDPLDLFDRIHVCRQAYCIYRQLDILYAFRLQNFTENYCTEEYRMKAPWQKCERNKQQNLENTRDKMNEKTHTSSRYS